MYGGGIGTIHELLSFMVYWYKEPDKMPNILFCNTDAEHLSINLLNVMLPLCIETRPYMNVLVNKIKNIINTPPKDNFNLNLNQKMTAKNDNIKYKQNTTMLKIF